MNKFTFLVIFLFAFLTFQSNAQNYMGIQFNYMQPLDDYDKNLNANPRGFGLNYMFKPKVFNKFYIGAQFGVSMYATDSYELEIENEEDEWLNIEIDEEDCFISYNFLGRYYLIENKRINPYLESRIGGLSFFSTKITDEDHDEYYENSTVFHGTAIQLGIGGGISINVTENFWIDINVIYNNGGRTKYRNIGSTDAEYRLNPDLGKFESYTDNVHYNLGVLFSF